MPKNFYTDFTPMEFMDLLAEKKWEGILVNKTVTISLLWSASPLHPKLVLMNWTTQYSENYSTDIVFAPTSFQPWVHATHYFSFQTSVMSDSDVYLYPKRWIQVTIRLNSVKSGWFKYHIIWSIWYSWLWTKSFVYFMM